MKMRPAQAPGRKDVALMPALRLKICKPKSIWSAKKSLMEALSLSGEFGIPCPQSLANDTKKKDPIAQQIPNTPPEAIPATRFRFLETI